MVMALVLEETITMVFKIHFKVLAQQGSMEVAQVVAEGVRGKEREYSNVEVV